MKALPFIAAAVSVLAAAGALAEPYHGVHPLSSARQRADVAAEAVLAARAPDPFAEGASSGVAPALTASIDRALVRAEAVAAAHAPNQNLEPMAFVNSVIPDRFSHGVRDARLARDSATPSHGS